MVSSLLLSLLISLPFKTYLNQQKCGNPEIFAVKNAIVLNCEASNWKKDDITNRTLKLLSALLLEHPYSENLSLILRKSDVPVIEIISQRQDLLQFFKGKISSEEVVKRFKAYHLEGKLYKFTGIPQSIGKKEIKESEIENKGEVQLLSVNCLKGKIQAEISYSFEERGRVLLVLYKEDKIFKTKYIEVEGGGTKSIQIEGKGGEFLIRLMVWRGKWKILNEKKIQCKIDRGKYNQ